MRSGRSCRRSAISKRARTAVERLIQLVERRLHRGHESADLAAAPIVLQLRGDDLGLAQMLELAPAFTELAQHRPQVETQLETAPQRGLALRQVLQDAERLLVARAGVGQRRARGGLAAGHVQVMHRLVFELAAHGMMGKPLDVLAEPVGIELFHGLDDAGVGVAAALLQQLVIGDVVGERVGEGVLQVGKQLRGVEEFGRLQVVEQGAQVVLRQPADRLQEREGKIVADHGRFLQQALFGGRQLVDARGEHRLHRRRHVVAHERPRQAIFAAAAFEHRAIDQRAHDLFDEEWIAARRARSGSF